VECALSGLVGGVGFKIRALSGIVDLTTPVTGWHSHA
jgi:hypothetical protein